MPKPLLETIRDACGSLIDADASRLPASAKAEATRILEDWATCQEQHQKLNLMHPERQAVWDRQRELALREIRERIWRLIPHTAKK